MLSTCRVYHSHHPLLSNNLYFYSWGVFLITTYSWVLLFYPFSESLASSPSTFNIFIDMVALRCTFIFVSCLFHLGFVPHILPLLIDWFQFIKYFVVIHFNSSNNWLAISLFYVLVLALESLLCTLKLSHSIY